MAARKPKTVRVLAAELNMSLGHINDAMKAGVDIHNQKELRKYRDQIRPCVDARSDLSNPPRQQSKPGESTEMTLDEIETALKAKGISVSEATTLKRQLEGLKLAAAVRKEMNQLLSRDEVGQRDIRIGAAVSAALRVMESELPQLCLGLPLDRSRPLVKERIRAIQAQLADGLSQFWIDHPEQ